MKQNTCFSAPFTLSILIITAFFYIASTSSFAASDMSEPTKTSPWSFRLFYGTAIFSSNETDALMRKTDNLIGNALIEFKSGNAKEISVDYRPSNYYWFRVGYQDSTLDFGTDLMTWEESFTTWKSIQFGTAHHHMVKLSAFCGGPYEWKPWEISYAGGFMIDYSWCSNIKASREGIEAIGIERITSSGGISGGLEAEVQIVLGHSNFALGLGGTLMIRGGGARLNIRTSEDSGFESASTKFAGNTMGVTLSYRLR